jgi:inosine-uridine nucleoside N-ribohydrolase
VSTIFADLLGFYLKRSQEIFRLKTASMHDPCAILPLLRPDLISYQSCHVHVELASRQLRGMTACDLRNVDIAKLVSVRQPRPANAQVAVAIDGAAAVDLVIEAILSYDA